MYYLLLTYQRKFEYFQFRSVKSLKRFMGVRYTILEKENDGLLFFTGT